MGASIKKTGVINAIGSGIGENLLLDTLKDSGKTHTTYPIADYNLTESMVVGEEYVVSAKVITSEEKKSVCFYHSGGSINLGPWRPITDDDIYISTFVATDRTASQTAGIGHGFVRVYVSNNTGVQGSTTVTGTANVEWIKIEKGSVATPWIPNEADELYVGKPGFVEGSEVASIGDDYIVGDEFYEI